MKDIYFDSTIRYDASFFANLNRIIQNEPWIDRDRVMIDQLKTLGIEKGKPYAPSAETKKILNDAAQRGHAELAARDHAGLPAFFEGNIGLSLRRPN